LRGESATGDQTDRSDDTDRDDPPQQAVAREDCPNTHDEKDARFAL
jgi:hypothetical protein